LLPIPGDWHEDVADLARDQFNEIYNQVSIAIDYLMALFDGQEF